MIEWPRLLAFAADHPGEIFALVSLVRCEGSSYRPPGARLLVTARGEHAGSVSGGCLEEELARAAQRVIADGVPVLHTVDTRPHFGCHGRLTLFIERLTEGFLERIAAHLKARESFVLHTRYRSATGCLGSTLGAVARRADESVFEEIVGLRPRLLVVSGSADATPVLSFCELLGWDARRILPVGEVVFSGRAADAQVCAAEELPVRFPPDARTAVLVMTHHLARDTHYLRHVLPAAYAYVGLLGSRRRREAVLGVLGEDGLLADERVMDRLRAPVGLDLGATDPASIALSIVAEIQAIWADRDGSPLRQRRGPIHDTPRVVLV